MRDFRAETADVKCWDRETHEVFERTGIPGVDHVLQNREELIAFCEWIERNEIRSFLEIGIWTGGLLTLLSRLFRFDMLAACDNLYAQSIGLPMSIPAGTLTFFGNSQSAAYEAWRAKLGHVDVVMIDGDHSYEGVRRDFEINRRYPHRFLVFHDIIGYHPMTDGVRRLWNELDGDKTEIVLPHLEIGLEEPTMGIGIWRNPG
ncbi:MAG TPA: class I SAM-dependent methyltransferase [Thermoanaerobaculia bacterium]